MSYGIFKTTWGWMGVVASSAGIRKVCLPKASKGLVQEEMFATDSRGLAISADALGQRLIDRTVEKLFEYLDGKAVTFSEPLDREGLTAFQRRLGDIAQTIPYGEVRSYGWLAQEAGSPRAARAAGQCMARNRFPIVVPCHRVIGASGSLIGFGGGLDLKSKLLRLEGWEPSGGSAEARR